MKKLTLKIICLALATVLISGSTLDKCSLKARAAAAVAPFAFSAEASAEIWLLLTTLLETSMLTSGANEGMDEYVTSAEATDAFIQYMNYMNTADAAIAPEEHFADMTLEDGTVINATTKKWTVTYPDQSVQVYDSDDVFNMLLGGDILLNTTAVGSDDVVTPDTDLQEEWKKAFGDAKSAKWLFIPNFSTGGDSGQEPDEGDTEGEQTEDNKNPFTKLNAVTLGAVVFATAKLFIEALWNDEVDGLDKETYYYPVTDGQQEYYFDGSYDKNVSGNYIIKGFTRYQTDIYDAIFEFNTNVNSQPVAYKNGNCIIINSFSGTNVNKYPVDSTMYMYKLSDGSLYKSKLLNASDYTYDTFCLNIPVFTSKEAVLNYFENGDKTGLLNGTKVDYPRLSDTAPQVLAPLTGKKISPNSVPAVNTALSEAVKAVEPDTAVDVETNTQTYIQTVTDVVTQTEIEVLPDTETGTGGGTTTDTPTGTDTDNPDGSGDEERSSDFKDFLNAILILIYILFALLQIFLHCLEFIICIFKIPATPGYLPDDMILGLDYLKNLEITGMGISVYDFMLGLVYIIIVFFFIGMLRKNIDRIKIPKQLHSR